MDELESYLHNTREFLEEIIDIDFGLIDKLHSKKVLYRREIEDITAKKTFIQRNSMLLDIILMKRKIPELCEALKETGQQHIVNYLKACGERSLQFDEDWPLTEKEISIIESSHEVLVDILETCDLIDPLYSKGVINQKQRDFILSKSTSYEKNKALLEILRRSSLKSYYQTLKCLHESNQKHIGKILERGGIIIPVHATVENDNLEEREAQIVDKMAKLLLQRNTSLDQANRLLSAVQLNIISVKRGQ